MTTMSDDDFTPEERDRYSLRHRIACRIAGEPNVSVTDAYNLAEMVIDLLELSIQYENARVMYDTMPAACKANGLWKQRIVSPHKEFPFY